MADIFNYLRNHAARYRGSGIGATSANAATPISTLSDLDQHLTDWYQNAPIGFHTLDANGIYTEVNETELRWLGYRRDELVGKMHIASLAGMAPR